MEFLPGYVGLFAVTEGQQGFEHRSLAVCDVEVGWGGWFLGVLVLCSKLYLVYAALSPGCSTGTTLAHLVTCTMINKKHRQYVCRHIIVY